MSEIQDNIEQTPLPSQSEIDLQDMGDRFKVAEYFLKMRNQPPFTDDPHPAAKFVAEAVSAFADEQLRVLMGAEQSASENDFPFSENEISMLKNLAGAGKILLNFVAELQKPVQRQPEVPVRQQQRPVPVQTSSIPGRRPQGPTPQVGTVGRGPLSKPTLSKEEMEVTTHAQSQIVAQKARNALLGFRTGANPGRDHSGSDE